MTPRFRHRTAAPYGQHFLHDRNLLAKIVKCADLDGEPHVLEVGVGTGKLTRMILDTGARVTGVEVDDSLFDGILKNFDGEERFRLVQGDIMKLPWDELLPEGEKTVLMGNLPYAVSTQILFSALDNRKRISRAVFLVQWEVGNRMAADPGSRDFGRLSVACQLYGHPELVRKVPPGVFLPPPKVDSALVRWNIYEEPSFPVPDRSFALKVVKAAFGQRRKKLANSLTAGLSGWSKTQIINILSEMDIPENTRAEQLSVEQFALLATRLHEQVARG